MRLTKAQQAAEKHHRGPGRLVALHTNNEGHDVALAGDGTLYQVFYEQVTETPEGGEPQSHVVARLAPLPIEWPEEE